MVNYTASGSFSPSAITPGTGGYTTFNWVATNPNPSTTCQGYTPVPSMTFTGTIFNKGNDTGSGQWTRSDGISGSLSLETNLVLTPTGELLQSGGWGQTLTTELNVIQSLIDTTSYDPPDPNSNKFQGRQVYETGTGAGSDACWNAANASVGTPPFPQLQITGSIWNVGAASGYSNNAYGYDTIGYDPHSVSWYRTNAPGVLPCTTTLNQTMMIVDQIPGFGDDQFATHTIQVTLGPNYITVTKDKCLPNS